MTDETFELFPNPDGKYVLKQLTLQEETYCQLRASGETGRESCRRSFGEGLKDKTLDSKVMRLEDRPEIQARIAEIRYHVCQKEACEAEKWRKELAGLIYRGAKQAVFDPKMGGLPAAVKGFTALGTMYGWMEPQRLEIATKGAGSGALDAKEVDRKLDKLIGFLQPKEGDE